MTEYFFWMAIQRSWMVPQQHYAFMMMSRSFDTTISGSFITQQTAAWTFRQMGGTQRFTGNREDKHFPCILPVS